MDRNDGKRTLAHCATTKDEPTYWDNAFLVGEQQSKDVITLNTAATLMMFGNHRLLHSIASIPPRQIGVELKGNTIIARHQGVFKMGGLKVQDVYTLQTSQ